MESASLIAKFHVIPRYYSSSSDSGGGRRGWVRETKPQGKCAQLSSFPKNCTPDRDTLNGAVIHSNKPVTVFMKQ